MEIDQFLYGYSDGHRLIAGSSELSDSHAWELVRATDRPSVSRAELARGITFGFPLDDSYYALGRTWSASEVDRPGAVWTHVVLLTRSFASPIQALKYLRPAAPPVVSEFREPIRIASPQRESKRKAPTREASRLLLVFASKPTTGFVASCAGRPDEVLSSAQRVWGGLLDWASFSTAPGKKVPIGAGRGVVVLTSVETALKPGRDIPYELGSGLFDIPSVRIREAWKILEESPAHLCDWLDIAAGSMPETTANLKLALEVLLLGQGILEDGKLLARVANAVEAGDGDPRILQHVGGERVSDIDPPPGWILAGHLMRESDWQPWSRSVRAESLARTLLSAPVAHLAASLVSSVDSPRVREVKVKIASQITATAYSELADLSQDAARELVRINPSLVFELSQENPKHLGVASGVWGTGSRNCPGTYSCLRCLRLDGERGSKQGFEPIAGKESCAVCIGMHSDG